MSSHRDFDVLIRGGSVVSVGGTARADLAVRNGKIVAVGKELNGSASRVIAAEGKHVLPGVIDPHVHMTNAGRTLTESCELETPSMAAGGVTTCFTMAKSYESYLKMYAEDVETVRRHSLIDVGFHAIISSEQHLEEIDQVVAQFNATSFKMFFAAKGQELFPGVQSVDDGYLYRAFREISRLGNGALALVHPEDWEIAGALAAELQAAGRMDAAAWTDSRPAFVEEEGIRRAIYFARITRCPLYLVHCSIGSTAELVSQARALGVDVMAETCPQFLTVHRDHPLALMAKYAPAVKEAHDVKSLWKGLQDGRISTLGSDHIPVRAADKDLKGKDVWSARPGLPGSGTILIVLLSEGFHKGQLSLERVVEVTSYNAARALGLFPRKGHLGVGADADVVIVDLEKTTTARPDHFELDILLYDGWEMRGWPVLTMVRGDVIFEDGEVVGKPGTGRYVHD